MFIVWVWLVGYFPLQVLRPFSAHRCADFHPRAGGHGPPAPPPHGHKPASLPVPPPPDLRLHLGAKEKEILCLNAAGEQSSRKKAGQKEGLEKNKILDISVQVIFVFS